MATVTELTYNISTEFPLVKRYENVSLIRGDDVTLRFTQPSSEDWTTFSYNITVYNEVTRETLGSTPFNASTTILTINNFNFDVKRALVVLEDRQDTGTKATSTMTVTGTSSENDFIQITYDSVQVEAFVTTEMNTDQIATAIVDAINADGGIQVTASVIGSVITFTEKIAESSANSKTITFRDANSTGVTVSGSAIMSGGNDPRIRTYKTIGHINFVVYEGGASKLTHLGFGQITLEDGSTSTIPYFQTGFEVG